MTRMTTNTLKATIHIFIQTDNLNKKTTVFNTLKTQLKEAGIHNTRIRYRGNTTFILSWCTLCDDYHWDEFVTSSNVIHSEKLWLNTT